MTVTELAYAKLNLYLDIVGRRADGYHELVTVMQSISLCDTLHATRVAGEAVSLLETGGSPCGNENLAVRAANAYFAAVGKRFGVELRLEKRIPMQAGLGGGSSDAAATLRALNRLNGNALSLAALCQIGAGLGADVPFCVAGGTALCRGIGEQIQPVASTLQSHVVVAMAGEGISTPQAFAALDEKYGDFSANIAGATAHTAQLLPALERGELQAVSHLLYNRFEELVPTQRPAVDAVKKQLLSCGAVAAQMSGSGPAVFGLFNVAQQAAAACERLTQAGVTAFACHVLA